MWFVVTGTPTNPTSDEPALLHPRWQISSVLCLRTWSSSVPDCQWSWSFKGAWFPRVPFLFARSSDFQKYQMFKGIGLLRVLSFQSYWNSKGIWFSRVLDVHGYWIFKGAGFARLPDFQVYLIFKGTGYPPPHSTSSIHGEGGGGINFKGMYRDPPIPPPPHTPAFRY